MENGKYSSRLRYISRTPMIVVFGWASTWFNGLESSILSLRLARTSIITLKNPTITRNVRNATWIVTIAAFASMIISASVLITCWSRIYANIFISFSGSCWRLRWAKLFKTLYSLGRNFVCLQCLPTQNFVSRPSYNTNGHSCMTELLTFFNSVLTILETGLDVDVVYLDLAKAFDKVDHNILLLKLFILASEGSYSPGWRNFN